MPKTTLRFHRTHGTHGSCLIKAYGLLQWRIQIKISQERWHNRTESKRGHTASFQLPPATPLQSDIDIWQCTSSIANREPHASLGVVQVFWVPVTQTRGTYVTDLLLSSISKCQTGIESLSLPPGSSVHGILQARILEWIAIPSSREFSWPSDQTHNSCISCVGRQILYC